ncbi:MAG: hypothetical protein JXM71_05940, partial [Spirochaetales bacterium]|nr:hypothetical protein [Spirochaetales bacterium]
MKTNMSLRFVSVLSALTVLVSFLASCSTLDISRAVDVDYAFEYSDDGEPDVDYSEDTDAESSPVVYKTLTLDAINVTIDVPSDWELFSERRGGDVYYFIGMVEDWFEFDYSQVP